jgi:hypothetical protein
MGGAQLQPQLLKELSQDPFLAITCNPAKPATLLAYNHLNMCHIDLEAVVPKAARVHSTPSNNRAAQELARKRKRASIISDREYFDDAPADVRHAEASQHNSSSSDISNNSNSNFVIVNRYRPLLLAEYMSASELLVVECPWSRIEDRLPNTLFKQRYGT